MRSCVASGQSLTRGAVSTLASWRQILDPWGRLGLGPSETHLFLASIVILAVSIVLVGNTADATLTLDGRRAAQRARPPRPTTP